MIEKLEYLIENNYESLGIEKPNKIDIVKVVGNLSNNGAVSFLIFLNDNQSPTFYSKVQRNPKFDIRIKNEYSKLNGIRSVINDDNILKTIPKTFGLFKLDDFEILLESASLGTNLNCVINRRNAKKYLDMCTKWLIKFHKSSMKSEKRIIDFVPDINDLILEGFLNEHEHNELLNMIDNFAYQNVPITCIHGDFSPYNIKIINNSLNIIDWEDSELEHIPIIDLWQMFIVTGTFGIIGSKSPSNFMKNIIQDRWYRKLIDQQIENYCREMKIDRELVYNFIPIYLLKAIEREIKRDSSDFQFWVELLKIYLNKNW